MSGFLDEVSIIKTLSGHNKPVFWVLVDDGKLYTTSFDVVKIWDISADYNLIATLDVQSDKNIDEAPMGGMPGTLAISGLKTSANKLYVSTYDGYILVYDCSVSGEYKCIMNLPTDSIVCNDHSLSEYSQPIYSMAIDSESNCLYIGQNIHDSSTRPTRPVIKVYNINDRNDMDHIETLEQHRGIVSSIVIGQGTYIDEKMKMMYSSSFDRTIIVWNLVDYSVLKTHYHLYGIDHLYYSHGMLYSASQDGICIYDCNDGAGENVCTIQNDDGRPYRMALDESSNGGDGDGGSGDGKLYVRDLHKPGEIKIWNVARDTLFHPDGREYMNTKSKEEGDLLATLEGPINARPDLCVADNKLYCGGEENTVLVWRLR